MKTKLRLLPFTFAIMLFLCSCTTAYGPYGYTGGYKERKIDDDSYIVSFFGNGNTSGQQVWNYWVYRCAELTLKNGFEFFELRPSEKHASIFPNTDNIVQFEFLDAKNNENIARPVYYYTTTVTTYSSKAIVNMYKTPIPDNTGILLHAQTILDELKPYVDSKARAKPPAQKDIMIRAAIEAAIKTNKVNEDNTKDLEELLNRII